MTTKILLALKIRKSAISAIFCFETPYLRADVTETFSQRGRQKNQKTENMLSSSFVKCTIQKIQKRFGSVSLCIGIKSGQRHLCIFC